MPISSSQKMGIRGRVIVISRKAGEWYLAYLASITDANSKCPTIIDWKDMVVALFAALTCIILSLHCREYKNADSGRA